VQNASQLASRVAAIDDEIKAVLARSEPYLQPFYGMMLYHLGLDALQPTRGKRLRPLLCALIFEALGGDPRRVMPAAAALELLHNFTLIHDDIEDQDPTRHHRPTVWSVWGEPQAINTGDGMYAVSRLAVQRLRGRGFPAERILDFTCLLDEACVRVCEGQFLDISFETRTDVTADRYRGMVARKTGALIAASAEGAAVLATDDQRLRDVLARFGDDYGQAFQAHDDLMGVWGTSDRTGKLELNDLTKRKKTLPMVLAFERASPKVGAELAELYGRAAPLPQASVERVREILDDLGIRGLIAREIASHRSRALHLLRGIGEMAAAGEALPLLQHLVESTTGVPETAAA